MKIFLRSGCFETRSAAADWIRKAKKRPNELYKIIFNSKNKQYYIEIQIN